MDAATLAARQSLPLNAKLTLTKQSINAFDRHFDGMEYISFSGGKDSTVLSWIIREEMAIKDIPMVFVDTGLEYPEVRKFAIERADVVLRPKKTFKQVIEQHGYPFPSKEQARYAHDIRHGTENMRNMRLYGTHGRSYTLSKKWYPLIDAPFEVSNYCCDVMKKNPLKVFERERELHPFIATMTEESSLRKNRYIANGGCNALETKRPHSTPMAFWTEQDVLKLISEEGIEIPSVYGEVVCEDGVYRTTGCHRTGCVFCMFGVHLEQRPNRFERLKETHPKLYSYCMDDLGCAKVLDMFDIPR